MEVIFDVGKEQDKKYQDKRNEELGTHVMDDREKKYKLEELKHAKKYYTDQVEHHHFGDSEAAKTAHARDKAMLNSINKSIAAIQSGEDAYSVVVDGFDEKKLSGDEKKEYNRLKKRVDDQQKEVNYHGGDKQRLANRKRKLDRFINEHQNASVSTGIVNKPTAEELDKIKEGYIQEGDNLFADVDPEMMKILGITDAIESDDVQAKRDEYQIKQIQEQEAEKQSQPTTDDIAASQGLVTEKENDF